jgi:hypothetical protein
MFRRHLSPSLQDQRMGSKGSARHAEGMLRMTRGSRGGRAPPGLPSSCHQLRPSAPAEGDDAALTKASGKHESDPFGNTQ